MLPDPKSERKAVTSALAITRNASTPFVAPYETFGIYDTEYRTVANLIHLRYYFELSTSPNVSWVDLSKLDFTADSPVKILEPDNLELSGNAADQLKTIDKPPF